METFWNNRIIRHKHPKGDWYAIHEVFYDSKGNPEFVTQEPIDVSGESVKDLLLGLKHIYKDAHKFKDEVLDFDSFKPKRKRK
jgi:hypothetical protein